jgi:hypothetical protein
MESGSCPEAQQLRPPDPARTLMNFGLH